MSNDQQPNEEKAPTIWHVLGAGVLVGVIMGSLTILIGGGEFQYLLVSSITAFIGAALGMNFRKSNKWEGLWVGAVLGSLVPLCLGSLLISVLLSMGQ